MRFSLIFGSISLFILSAGCAASAPESTAGGEDAVVGVTDLTALESELALVKDVRDANGNWSRPESKVAAGACYKKLLGGSHAASYELRRYKDGAAFFKTAGSAGDVRQVACVDFDVADPNYADGPTLSISGVVLDATVRYHLGRPQGYDGGLGHMYADFAGGMFELGFADHWCGNFGMSGVGPGTSEYAEALTSCKHGGSDEDTCSSQAMRACEVAVNANIAKDTIDAPKYDAVDLDSGAYLYSLQIKEANSSAYLPAGILTLAYRHAKAHSAQLGDDPVGKFVSFEDTSDELTTTQHARFAKSDVHRLVKNYVERIAVTPKNSDDDVVGNARVLCTRAVDDYNRPTAAFQCTAL